LEHKLAGGIKFDKLEEYSKNLTTIGDEKTELEELYIKSHAEIVKHHSRLIEA
jgi:hypothetical protein